MDDIRDADEESGYAIDQLENIAWAAASSGQQSPQTATQAVRTPRDLLAHWLIAGERDRSERCERPDELPVVYTDGTVPRTLDALASIAAAASEGRQAATCAEAVHAFADIEPSCDGVHQPVEVLRTAVDGMRRDPPIFSDRSSSILIRWYTRVRPMSRTSATSSTRSNSLSMTPPRAFPPPPSVAAHPRPASRPGLHLVETWTWSWCPPVASVGS